MKRLAGRLMGVVLAATLPLANANAQIEDLLGKGRGSELKGLAGVAGSPLASGSMGNVAGLLQYCIGKNYLGGDAASTVKDQLMQKLPGADPTADPGYSDGRKGLLHGGNGKLMDLGGGDLKAEVTKKACETILAQARSFL